jgi:hypothetical protein
MFGILGLDMRKDSKLTLEQMQKLAKPKGGKFLSKEYVNALTKHKWQCKNGHKWEANAHDIKSGHWCRKCSTEINAAKHRLTIEEMQEIATSRGGKCLSNNYANANTKLKWQCKEGHVWEAIPSSIKTGKWCLKCAGKTKLTIEEMQKLAESKGGKCLSKKYVDVDTKLEWKCEKGHKWLAIPYTVKKGTWCSKCSTEINAAKHRLTIEEMQKLAGLKGGECVSKVYTNSNAPLEWQCEEGHIWKARANNIKQGQWCPNCARGVGERTCRKYFENIFDQNFPSSKPSWLVTKNGTRLELDGYSKELKLAFEYHGIQHYKDVGFFTKTMSLKKRKEYDKLKVNICKQKGVNFIIIPYKIKLENMGNYITRQCKKLGIVVPNKEVKLESFKFYYPEKIKELQEIAKSRGGKLLSDTYLGSKKKLKWECEEGHKWEAVPNSIKNGRWCAYCSHRVKRTIEEMQELAKSKGGKCLSKKYINTKTKLKWQCGEGHIWEAYAYNVKSGYWCHVCNRKRKANKN